MKYLSLFLLLACNHVCPPTTKVVTHYNTVIEPRVDTLVIIQTYDSVPYPGPDALLLKYYDETRPIELFKDGKRSDTIYRRETIYVNKNK